MGFVESGRLAEADAICLEILAALPGEPQATFLRGLIAYRQGEADRGIALIRDAAVADPANAAYLATLGALLAETGEPDAARGTLERAVALNPEDAASLRQLARLNRDAGRIAHAVAALDRIGKPETDDLILMGQLLQGSRGPDAAVSTFERAVVLAPDSVPARNHLAACQQLRGHVGEAIAAYRESLASQPDDNPATVGLFAAMQTVCDWRSFDELAAQVDAMTEAAATAGRSAVEDPFLNVTRKPDPRQNHAVARLWSADLSRRVAGWGVDFEHAPRERDRIRIGYLSSDFHDHATAHLMLGLFGAHDRARFSVHAYSCGPDDGSTYRSRIEADCDSFTDLAGTDSIAAARRIHGDGIDILVDLKGYTRQNRLDISALRPAPVQVAWLGFPGTSGADFFDYIVTDDIVAPPGDAGCYSEAFAVMPHSYQVNNREQEIDLAPVSRAEAGLPENGFVFASFNNTYKLEPVMFAAWMAVLRAVPDSVLWLLPNNPAAAANLRREAEAAGVAPERLAFAGMLPKARHLKRAGLAGLALDTRLYNGHTTTSDMLWAGVPVVTLKGTHFASRVSASLLTAFGLPDLIAGTLEDYTALATDLARSPDRLAEIREKTARQRLQSPLFDTADFARDLERLYTAMWRRKENGEAPERLAAKDLD